VATASYDCERKDKHGTGIMLYRIGILIYAAGAYCVAMASIGLIAGFLQDFGVPKGINDGSAGALWPSVLIDIGLVWAFGLHHSVTARASFKRLWKRYFPPELERATYLYMTAILTLAVVYFWRPIPDLIWQIDHPLLYWSIISTYLLVLAAMFSATFPIGHFAFFGLAPAWHVFAGRKPEPAGFTTRWLYAVVRHPISLGWMVLPWLTPAFSLGQLCFALATASYVIVATAFEEADLSAELGKTYEAYRERVPAFLPFRRRRTAAPAHHERSLR